MDFLQLMMNAHRQEAEDAEEQDEGELHDDVNKEKHPKPHRGNSIKYIQCLLLGAIA